CCSSTRPPTATRDSSAIPTCSTRRASRTSTSRSGSARTSAWEPAWHAWSCACSSRRCCGIFPSSSSPPTTPCHGGRPTSSSASRPCRCGGSRDSRPSRPARRRPCAHASGEAMSRPPSPTGGVVVKERHGVGPLGFQLAALAIVLAAGGRALAADQIDDALSNAGQVWYAQYCTPCHGPGGAPGDAVSRTTKQSVDLRTYVQRHGGAPPARR